MPVRPPIVKENTKTKKPKERESLGKV